MSYKKTVFDTTFLTILNDHMKKIEEGISCGMYKSRKVIYDRQEPEDEVLKCLISIMDFVRSNSERLQNAVYIQFCDNLKNMYNARQKYLLEYLSN